MMFRRKSSKKAVQKRQSFPEEQQPAMQTTVAPPSPDTEEEEDPWSEEAFMDIANHYNLNEDQQVALITMRDNLADVDHWKNAPFEVIRILKECKYNTSMCEEKFRKMVHWRMEKKIDNFLDQYGDPHPLFDYFPSVVLKGVDRDGDPVFVERPGALDAYGMYKEMGTQGMIDYITWKREKDMTRGPGWQLDYYEPTYGKRVGQFTAIFDVEGLNRNHMRAGLLPLLNQVARLTQDYYPGVAKRIIVLRAPHFFKMFWGLVKNFFDPCIREIVEFTNSKDYLEVLDRYMDRSILPPELDAEQGRGGYMPGFENVRLEGGPITKEVIAQCKKRNGKRERNNSADITETTSYSSSEGSSLFMSEEYAPPSSGVKVAGGLLGGGTFRGEMIYLQN